MNDQNNTRNTREEHPMSQGISKTTAAICSVVILVVGIALGLVLGGVFVDSEPEPEQSSAEDQAYEQAKPQLEQHLRQQREQELVMDHIDQLKEDGSVETFLDEIDDDDSAVVALVNGEEILLEALLELEEQQRQGMAAQGLDPDSEEAAEMMREQRPQMLDNLVITLLLQQKAAESGITVTEEEVNEQIERYIQQYGSREALDEQVEQVGMSEDDLYDMISDELMTQKYLEGYVEENLSDEDLEFSDEELREAFVQMQQQQQMQQQIQQQMQQQQQ